jgi:two-component system OmpR family sensor kinase
LFKPATWHLRTRLILLSMALLVAISGAIGVVSYATMDVVLTNQLDAQLMQASRGRPPEGNPSGRPDPLDARGQSVGTLNARVVNGQISREAGFLSSDATRTALTSSDVATLQDLPHDGDPVDRALSNG